MLLKTRFAAAAAVVAALALGTPVAVAAADSSLGSPRCPAWYTGPTNPATGCPYWVMIRDPGPGEPQTGPVPAFFPPPIGFGLVLGVPLAVSPTPMP
jgi:hypothetical protein